MSGGDIVALEAEAQRQHYHPDGQHYPERRVHSQTAHTMWRWYCWCGLYDTGYRSKTMSNRMILAHCARKNAPVDTKEGE